MERLLPSLRALLLLICLTVPGACEGSGPRGFELLVPSFVSVMPTSGQAVGVPVIVIRRGPFAAPLVGNFIESDVAALPAGMSVPLRDCTGQQPPNCPFRSIDFTQGQFVIWLTAAVADPAQVGVGTFPLGALVSTFGQPPLFEVSAMTLSIQSARGSFVASAPASVSLRDAPGEMALLPVSIAPDADFGEPVLVGVTPATARNLPGGIEVFARVCNLLARPTDFGSRDPCYDLFSSEAPIPECHVTGQSPPACADLFADLPSGDTQAVLVLRVSAPGNVGSYPLDVEARSVAVPFISSVVSLTLNVVSP